MWGSSDGKASPQSKPEKTLAFCDFLSVSHASQRQQSSFADVDVTKEPAPVLLRAHFNKGGISRIGRRRLCATTSAPEQLSLVLAGVANRLGANSVLDHVVVGRQAADATADHVKPNSQLVIPWNSPRQPSLELQQRLLAGFAFRGALSSEGSG